MTEAATSSPGWIPSGGPPRWIVCERSGRWAQALRRTLEPESVRLVETRSLDHCWELLANWPGSFVVAEWSPQTADGLLVRLVRREREFPLARVAVVADRALAGAEPLVREAGAVWFVASPRGLAPLVAIARRHLATVPRPRTTLAQRFWAALPWRSAAE